MREVTRGARMLLMAVPFLLARGAGAQEAPRAELPRTPATSEAAAADVESIDAIIGALYDVISGAAGEPRDWERMRSLFHPGARLIPTGLAQDGSRATAVVQSVDDYIRVNGPLLTRDGFFEEELQREVTEYGHIAQVFSSYASRRAPDGPVFMRGINAIHLLNDGTRWWLMTVYWNSESAREPLPERWSESGR